MIAIIKFGNDSTRQISKVLDKLGFHHHILDPDQNPEYHYSHVILSGGPKHVYEKDHDSIPIWIIESDVKVLGICYGFQILASCFGARVEPIGYLKRGSYLCREVINGKCYTSYRWMNRYDRLRHIDGFHITGYDLDCDIVSFTDNRKYWAVQYHPENESLTDFNLFYDFLQK